MSYLLKLLGLFVLLRLSSSQACPSDSDLNADVIIIGAGMAGISAAERLQEGGINNILILEGSEKIGGRVRSVEMGGVTVSQGCAWIQGVDETQPGLNPLWQVAQRYGGLRGLYLDYDSLTNYDSRGNQPDEAQFRNEEFYAALSVTDTIAKQLSESEGCANVNFRSGLSQGGWTPASDIDNWIEWFNSDYYAGVEPENLSLCLHENDPTYTAFLSGADRTGSDYFVTDPNGYESIIEGMANDAKLMSNQTRVVFNAEVTAVDTSHGDCVCVTANLNGVTNYCAKYAISTVSVGVLQQESIQFIPELLTPKKEVIQRFEMSHYVHLIMRFTEAFWDPTEQIGYIASRRAYYPIFLNYHFYYPEQPNILVVQITGDEADRVLRQDKAVTIFEVESILNTLYPTSNITILESVVTDWLNDPLFRGSYIYYSTDIRPGDHELLAAPVKNLYFSGSATSSNFSGYLHGAYYAGREAAESVIGRTNKAAKMQISILIVLLGVLCAFYYN